MATNIEMYRKKFAGKIIVVLTGYKHRSLLKQIMDKRGKIVVSEYYDKG